jgi:hypothetical protein
LWAGKARIAIADDWEINESLFRGARAEATDAFLQLHYPG